MWTVVNICGLNVLGFWIRRTIFGFRIAWLHAWIFIQNTYMSQTLDLSDPATFRDLSKPMGAQTEKRKQMFIQRYEEVEHSESEGILPVFSFWSCICGVLRLEFNIPRVLFTIFLGGLSAKCHYCTHYSSAIIVASFLVRMEPFSHTFQTLQV